MLTQAVSTVYTCTDDLQMFLCLLLCTDSNCASFKDGYEWLGSFLVPNSETLLWPTCMCRKSSDAWSCDLEP